MDCYKLSVHADDYQLPKNNNLTPSVQTLVVAAIWLELIDLDWHEDVVCPLPDPKYLSGPPPSSHLLRAPPVV